MKKKCPVVRLPRLSLSACLGVGEKKNTTMVDLKSAYVSLEYKHYHNIGSRRAAEQVITYDESVPIYESRINSQQTDYNSNRTLPNANLCEAIGNHISEKPKLHQQKCNTNCSSVQTSPQNKKECIKKTELKHEKKKDPSKTGKKTTVNRVSTDVLNSVPLRREASLNAKAKLNIFYHETDPIKGIDSSEDSSDEETLSAIAKSVSDGKKQDKVCEEKVKIQDKACEKKSTTSSQSKHKTPQKCGKGIEEKPKSTKEAAVKSGKSHVKSGKSHVKRTADSGLCQADSPKYARRVASLNAEAIMAVTGSSVPSSTQKAARTQVLEAARTKAYMSSRREMGRWVEGRGEEYIQALHNNAPIQWSNRDLVKDSSVKDGLPVKEGPQGPTSDPLLLGDGVVPTLDRVGNVDRPLCHTYQSPIHVNVEDCGPYVGSQPHIAAPLPRYSFSPAHSVAPAPQCQSYTLAGLGSLSNVQMVPFHQTYNSAFTVPCNHNINVPCNHGSACSLTAPYYGECVYLYILLYLCCPNASLPSNSHVN